MTNITIPLEAWKAAMMAYHTSVKLGPDEAWKAACLAMLRSWPGMVVNDLDDNTMAPSPAIILPLTEPRDDE